MTKKEFSKQIVNLVSNLIEEGNDEALITDEVQKFISVLTPIEKNQFSKWGHSSVQVDPSKCWD